MTNFLHICTTPARLGTPMRLLQRVSDSSWIALGLFLMAFSCCLSVEERHDGINKQLERISSVKDTDWKAASAQTNQTVTDGAARTAGGSKKLEDNRGSTARSKRPKFINKGPNCFAVEYNPPAVDAETCTTVCMKLWSLYMNKYQNCDDVDKCFYKDLKSSSSYLGFHTRNGLNTAVKTLKRCSFETRDRDAPLAQYQHEDIIITTHNGSNPAEWPIVCPNHTTVTILQALMKTPDDSAAGYDVSCPPWDAHADLDEECKSAWPYAPNHCILTSKTWKKALLQNPCGASRDLHVTLRYSCQLQVLNEWDACRLDNSQGTRHGACKCPAGRELCTVEQAEANFRWSRFLGWMEEPVMAAHYLVLINKKLQLEQNVPCSAYQILCKRPDPPGPLPGLSPMKNWTNRGPHCYRPVEKATAKLCTFACNILWNKVEDIATSQKDPFGWFLETWMTASLGEMTEFDSSVQTTLEGCSFEERDLLAPARQYEFEEWDTRGEFRNPCGRGKALDLVQVLMGCPAVLAKNRSIENCNYLDLTSKAETKCASMRTAVDGVCRIEISEKSNEVCPDCPDEVVFLWRWNCKYDSAAPHLDFTCTIREAAGASGVYSKGDSCACQNRATRCSLDEAKADMSWTQNRAKGTIQLLDEGFAYTSDFTGSHFKALYPSRQLCCDRSTQVLCKEPINENSPAPRLNSPDCALAFSKTAEASAFDHVVCSSACVRVLREICKQGPSRWLCVLQYIPKDCFVPPRDHKSCVLSVDIGRYSEQDRTCMCPDDTRPCTAEEARATRWQWESQESKVTTKLLHVAGGMALWPDGTLIPEYGLDTPTACADNRRYAGILCYGAGPSIGQLEDVKTADCEGTLPLDESTTTREQCNYACSLVKKACEQAVVADPGLHRTVAECISKKFPTTRWLQDCYLMWKILEPFKEPVMEMGLLTATETWTPVKFKHRMKSPVVVLSVPVASTVLGSVQIRNVQDDGFEVRYKTAVCGEDYVLPYTTTAWMALPTDRYAMKPFVAVRVDRVSVVGNRQVTLDYIVSVKAPQPVLLVQIQETSYEVDGKETLPIAVVDEISQTQANVRVASLRPLPPETVSTIGYVLIDHNEICANVLGCKLSRFKVETAVLQPEYGSELPVFRGSVEGTQPMIFASALQTGSFPIHHLMQAKQSIVSRAGSSRFTRVNRRSLSMFASARMQEAVTPGSLLQEKKHDVFDAASAAQPKLKQQRASPATFSSAAWPTAQLVASFRKRLRGKTVSSLLSRAHHLDVTSDSKATIEQVEYQTSRERNRSIQQQSRSGLSQSETSGEDDLMWNLVVDTVIDDRCLPNSISRELHVSPWQRPLLGVFYVKAGFPTMSSEKKLNYYPDCVNAVLKTVSRDGDQHYCTEQCKRAEQECASAEDGLWSCVIRTLSNDVKERCHIDYRAITEPTYATPVDPAVDPLANCMIVDMEAVKDQSERGWDMSAHSCNCPKGMFACPLPQVMYDWSSWVRSLSQGGKLCPTQTTVVKPVASHFRIPKTSLCDFSVYTRNNVEWEQLPLPPYSAEDVVLEDETVRSGAYQCRHDIRYVFCQGAVESKSTTTTTIAPVMLPQDRDCIPGEWGSWGPCSAICIGESRTSVPVKKRRRHIVLEKSGAGRQCALEMQTDCAVPWDVDYCENTCWRAEWGAWSDCTKTVWSVGSEPQLARARLRPIFYSGNAECTKENLIQRDTSSCSDVEQVEPSTSLRDEQGYGSVLRPAKPPVRPGPQAGTRHPGRVSALQLEQTTADSKDPSCLLASSWSSCTTPCRRANYPDPVQYRVWLRPVEKEQTKYCDFEQQHCVDLIPPCAEEEKVDCAKITAAYPVPDEIFACQNSCRNASQRCMQKVPVPGSTHLQCVLGALQWEMLQSARHCVYEPEATRWVLGTLSTCFLTGTQLANTTGEYPYVRTAVADGKGSCVCAVENSVPCSAQEVFETLYASPEILTNTTCPAQDLGALFTEENPGGSADSAVFFAASNMGRVHCPLSASSSQTAALPTYSSFSTLKELNAYCEHGLPSFNRIREAHDTFLAAACDEKIISKHDKGLTTQQCIDLCRSLVESCKADRLKFLQCAKEALQKDEFAKNCQAPQWKTLGRGLIFCKHVPKNCEFSPWSEWTPCSATCKEAAGTFTDVYRTRQRTLLSPSEDLGVCWDASGSRTFDVDFCTWLPLCIEKSEPTPPVTDVTEPHDENLPHPLLENITTCLVVDMSNYAEGRAYSAQYNSCLCPDGSRSCTSKEVMEVVPKEDLQRVFCSGAYYKNVYAQDGLKFECATGVFSPYHFSADPKADCQDYVDFLFCEVDPLAPGEQPAWVPVGMLLLGVVAGMVVSLSCVHYSGDMQAALGFTGKYVELTQQYEEMTAANAVDAINKSPEATPREKVQVASDTAEITNETISDGRRES